MPKIIRNLFLIFLLVALMSVNKSYGLNEDEDANFDAETDYMDVFDLGHLEVIGSEEENIPAGDAQSFEPYQISKKISLDIKGMDIVDVLKLLANQGNLNIVTGKNVTGRISMFLKDVNIWDAFEIIVAANGLAYERKGDIINVISARDYEAAHGKKYGDKRILSIKKLKYANAKDMSAVLNQIKSTLGKVAIDQSSNTLILLDVPERILTMEKIVDDTDISYDLITEVFELNYAQVDQIKDQLAEVLTENVGILRTDERTNKIIVVDYPNKITRIEKIIEAFDEKTQQVLIEAKIIQVTLSDEYKMGIDWQYLADSELNLTSFNINRSLTTTGSQVVIGETTPETPRDFKVIIDMLKTFGDAKTLSTPRIAVTNGQEAKILVGSKKVYVANTVVQGDSTTTTAEQVQFLDVGVKLYVTPIINKKGFITMKIRPEVSSATTSYTTAQGNAIPIVDTSEAETSVIVKDGVTLVMGGLMKNENINNVYKLPLLSEIPFLGGLFKRTEDAMTKTELVIFLTPHIVSGSESVLDAGIKKFGLE
ncbi:secretin N-terminal domain-containing protein [Candidatus Omnitrophota bacterium]